ncbi:MAG TPA: PGPGW domain-containing protein [Caulobacter sp.]|nr:PGPGW domain-containing protein [Caulobacter sp.]
MSLVLTMPRAFTSADDAARALVARVTRWALIALGVAIVLLGIAVAPLPGPGGLPVIVVGLMILLRNSFWAKRQFVRFQRAHPRTVFPIRRLLRREPEVFPVFWQGILRTERVILSKERRFARKLRRRFRKARR